MRVDKIKVIFFKAALFLSMMPVLRPFDVNFNYSDLLFLVVFLLILIEGFNKAKIDLFNSQKLTILYGIGLFLFACGFGISSIISESSFDFFSIITQYIMLFCFVPFIFNNVDFDSKKIIEVILFSMFCVIIFGIYIYFFTSNHYYSIGGRMGSFFKNPNTFAKTIALFFPLAFYYIYTYKSKFGWLMIFSLFLGLFMASSFGGIIASLISILLFFVLSKKLKQFMQFIVLIIISLLLYLRYFPLPEIFINRILPILQSKNIENAGSFSMKKSLIFQALEKVNENPIIGVGLGNYVSSNIVEVTVHNSYVLVWVEGGLLSLLGFIIVMLCFLIKILLSKQNQILFAASLSIWLIMILNFNTNVHFYNRYTFIPLLIVIFIMNMEENNTKTLRRPR